jgi:hypothetical protein
MSVRSNYRLSVQGPFGLRCKELWRVGAIRLVGASSLRSSVRWVLRDRCGICQFLAVGCSQIL